MKNLAGDPNCDSDIRGELTKAKINIVEATEPHRNEVPARLTGKLGPFTFTRAWYYWVVRGPMPLAAAEAMYADPLGKTDVRVAGHCACPAPVKPWVDTRMTSDGKPYQVVNDYHIDSLAGLRLFADTVRAHGLAVEPPAITHWTVEATEATVRFFAETEEPSPLMTDVLLDPRNNDEVNWADPRIVALRAERLPQTSQCGNG